MIVALYARVSTDKQTNDNQLYRLRDVAQARGYEVYKEYVDVASGAKSNRPALDEMCRDAKAHKFEKILAVKIDRIARSIINLLDVMTNLESWGIKIEFLDQPIDTSTPTGKFTLTILGALAEFERELIRDRTNQGLERAHAQGHKSGRREKKLSAYQLEKAKQILADNPDISNRKLAEQFDGISMNTLIKLLRAEGLIK